MDDQETDSDSGSEIVWNDRPNKRRLAELAAETEEDRKRHDDMMNQIRQDRLRDERRKRAKIQQTEFKKAWKAKQTKELVSDLARASAVPTSRSGFDDLATSFTYMNPETYDLFQYAERSYKKKHRDNLLNAERVRSLPSTIPNDILLSIQKYL